MNTNNPDIEARVLIRQRGHLGARTHAMRKKHFYSWPQSDENSKYREYWDKVISLIHEDEIKNEIRQQYRR